MPPAQTPGNTETSPTSSHSRPHASPTAPQGNDSEPTILATDCQLAYEFWTNHDQHGQSLKTFLDSLLWETDWYYGNFSGAWKISPITRSCLEFHLPPLEHYIAGIGYGWLPTPTKNDGHNSSMGPSQLSRTRQGMDSHIAWLMRSGVPRPAKAIWFELIMGCPPGWTHIEISEFPSWGTLLTPALSDAFSQP